jgi:hypothetical protein
MGGLDLFYRICVQRSIRPVIPPRLLTPLVEEPEVDGHLPLSLVVMRINWGGFFFDEPRWRIPLAFAIVGLLLQGGLFLLNQPALTSLANIGFAGALLYSLSHITNLLHPDSPILASSSRGIQFFFFGLLILSVIAGIQITAAISARLQHK